MGLDETYVLIQQQKLIIFSRLISPNMYCGFFPRVVTSNFNNDAQMYLYNDESMNDQFLEPNLKNKKQCMNKKFKSSDRTPTPWSLNQLYKDFLKKKITAFINLS